MPIDNQTSSTTNMFSLKVVLISSSVLAAAIMLTVDFADFVVPPIYNGLVSWLRPPYLYLVINCIIIIIVASSKLQSTMEDASPPLGIIPPQPVKSIQAPGEFIYDGVVLKDSRSYEVEKFDTCEHPDAIRNEQLPPVIVDAAGEDAMSNKENEWTAPESNDYSPLNGKPPVSARFSHRRNAKASPEGGRTVLGVSKPKRQDTLESTWKTITEGRPIPISRHLKKSDTWERDSHVHGGSLHPHHQHGKMMKKSETFSNRSPANSPMGSSGGSGKLRKESSLSQDELNRRVEAFIKKFNEEMRLQRQESLDQYKKMINRGSQ